jgi:hypothetical protein
VNIPLSTTGIQAVPQGNLRKSLLFQNTDGAINIYLKKTRPGEAVATTSDFDVRLTPGGSFAMNINDDGEEAVQEAWSAVAASGTPSLTIFETKDRKYL